RRRRHAAHHGAPHPSQHHPAGHRHGHPGGGGRHPGGRGAQLHRPGCTAGHARVGRHAQRRPHVHAPGLVDGHLPRHGHHPDGAGHQPAGRRPARRTGPAAAAVSPPRHRSRDLGEGIAMAAYDARPPWAEAYERYAAGVLERYGAPGMAVAVARDGRIIYEAGLGWRDREKRLPATPDTIFGIGSVTKSFTCMAIMQLVDEGRLAVDDPVVRYLPEFSVPNRAYRDAITIHHFMTHTSGLPPLPSLGYALARSLERDPQAARLRGHRHVQNPPVIIDTAEQLLEFIAQHDFELLGPPGAVFSYSNDAYALLGTIIERVSGQRYEDFVTRRILEPLGMT